jgi:hypothetical protein
MVSKTKLYTQLDSLEAELEEKLIPLLEQAIKGKNDLVFCVESFNPFFKSNTQTNKKTQALINIGTQILVLKGKLGESSKGSIAERLCWYCRKWDDLEDGNKNNAQSLAKQFLKEIVINK